MGKVLVKKRKGHMENFDIDKIKSSLLKAGCAQEEAERISKLIGEWAEKQPGKMIHSLEIERHVIDHTKDKHKDVLIPFLIHGKNKIKSIKRIFNRKDIAQMLTSLFVIIQVFVLESIKIPFSQAIPVLATSMVTCMTILWLMEGKLLWKHFISGFLLVSLLSLITGVILDVNASHIIIAISVGLPVAAMVDVLRS